MNILVLGATGRTGQHVVDLALQRGHEVTCLVRDPAKVTTRHDQLRVVAGSPLNPADLQKVTAGRAAVVSALGNPRRSDSPWAAPAGPTDVLERAARHLAAELPQAGVNRIVTLSTLGASESWDAMPLLMKLMISSSSLKVSVQDHTNAETVLRTSALNWTIVRAPMLTNDESDKSLRAPAEKPGWAVGRKNAARFMLDVLDDPATFQTTPTISER